MSERQRAFRKVLVPIDLSEDSHELLAWALALCQRGDEHITLLHVVDVAVHVWEALTAELKLEDLEARIMDRAGAVVAAVGQGVGDIPYVVTPRVEAGHPAWEILRVAREEDVDLIVLGSHHGSRGAFVEFMLGSVADKVIRGARVPVFVAPMQVAPPGAGSQEGV